MALTISTKTYSFDTNPTPDSALYTGPAKTSTIKDNVIIKRVAPKPTKDYGGVVRSSEKTVKTVLINGIARDLIAETTFNYPAQALPADVTTLRVDHSNLVANAATQTLVDNGKISY